MRTVSQLGYLSFAVSDVRAWEAFAIDVLGMGVSRRFADRGFSLRMDSYEQRIFVHPGDQDDLAQVGWRVDDADAMDDVCSRIRGAGIRVIEGSSGDLESRRVERMAKFVDPFGIDCELFLAPRKGDGPFRSDGACSGFVADELGLGHLVIGANSQAESQAFYCDLLGLCLTDRIRCTPGGVPVDIAFLRANARHHSIALGGRHKKRIHHFMVEYRAIDDVGRAFDRAVHFGTRIAQTLGRHPNDGMLSFYGHTPSGFQFECGFGGRLVEAPNNGSIALDSATFDRISDWGHHSPERIAERARRVGERGT